MLRGIVSRLNKGVGNAANWAWLFTALGGGTLLSAIGAWAASAWEPIAAQGWGAMVFAGVGLACAFMLTLSLATLAVAVAYRKFKPLAESPTPKDAKYIFGLAGGDRYIEGEFGHVMSAYESRLRHELEAQARSLKIELAPQDHAEKINALDSEIAGNGAKISELSEALKQVDRTILQLVDFATLQAVAASLDAMIASAPPNRPDAELSEESREKQVEYLGGIRSQMGGTHRGQSVANILRTAEHEAERVIEETPLEQRNPADPIRYRRWAIANHQVARVVMFLRSQRAEIEERIVGYRPTLIDELTKRSPP